MFYQVKKIDIREACRRLPDFVANSVRRENKLERPLVYKPRRPSQKSCSSTANEITATGGPRDGQGAACRNVEATVDEYCEVVSGVGRRPGTNIHYLTSISEAGPPPHLRPGPRVRLTCSHLSQLSHSPPLGGS